MALLTEWLEGTTVDGRLLPTEKVNAYRVRHGLPPLERALVANGSPRFRGLGDVVAAVTRVTGVDRVVKAVTGGGCGCKRRQQALNELVPFGGQNNG